MVFKKGHKPWNKGKTGVVSEETRRRMSEALKCRKALNKEKPHSEETKRKISKAKKGGIISEKTKRKISKTLKGRKKSKT